MTKLKPCPFCGEEPACGDMTEIEDFGYYYIECSSTTNHLQFAGVHADTKQQAIKAWNTRTP